MSLAEILVSLLVIVLILAVIDLWQFLRERRKKTRKVVRFVITRVSVEPKPEKEPKRMQVQLRTNQYARLAISPVDGDGNPAPLDGKPTVERLSGDAEFRFDGNDLLLIPSDVKGKSTFRVAGDAQEGEGVEIISVDIELDALNPNAVALNLGVTIGSKKDLPPVQPPVEPPTTPTEPPAPVEGEGQATPPANE